CGWASLPGTSRTTARTKEARCPRFGGRRAGGGAKPAGRPSLGRPAMKARLPLILSAIALFVALGGTVYAAGKINGRSIKVKSIPGNRLKPGSVPADRLRPGVLDSRPSGPLTGEEIDERSLGQVPSAPYPQSART